MGSSNVL